MSNFFYANKPDRNFAFHFPNGFGENAMLHAEQEQGDQSARVHPFPQSLAPGQKVGQPTPGEPATQLSVAQTVGRDVEY